MRPAAPGTRTASDSACHACLRRGALIGHLTPGAAGLLDSPDRRPAGLLGLPDEELVAALAGSEPASALHWLDSFRSERAREEVSAAGLESTCRHRETYPRALRDLPDAPATLYVAGGLERLAALTRAPAVTVVGARDATAYALEVATVLGQGLSAAGVTVVSGLALGVDAAAHRGATDAGGRAVAVLASGADTPYPRSHRTLYDRVRESGCVVSEMPPGTRPVRWGFPARNRIMAALGRFTVVVEAAEASGSLITATLASELGREVGAVPGRVTSARAAGSNRLLRDGVHLIRDAGDVLDGLLGVGASVDLTAADGAGVGRSSEHSGLDPPVRRVLEAVEAGHAVEGIGRVAALGPGEVRAALGRLELLGLVRRDGLGAYERSAR